MKEFWELLVGHQIDQHDRRFYEYKEKLIIILFNLKFDIHKVCRCQGVKMAN